MERERGTVNDSEGEGLYRYIPAAVVCNIMITLPGCLAASSLPRFPPTRPRLRGHPLSAAMLPGNMIIVIICTLLRPHPPDSSPPRGNPLILPLFSLPLSVFLSPIRATIVYRYDARNSVLAIPSSSLWSTLWFRFLLLSFTFSLLIPFDQTRFFLLLALISRSYEATTLLRSTNWEETNENKSEATNRQRWFCLYLVASLSRPSRLLPCLFVLPYSRLSSAIACKTLRCEMPSPRRASQPLPPFPPVPPRSFVFFHSRPFYSASFFYSFYFFHASFSLRHLPQPPFFLLDAQFIRNSSLRKRFIDRDHRSPSIHPCFFAALLRAFFHHPRNFPRVTNIEKYLRRYRSRTAISNQPDKRKLSSAFKKREGVSLKVTFVY